MYPSHVNTITTVLQFDSSTFLQFYNAAAVLPHASNSR